MGDGRKGSVAAFRDAGADCVFVPGLREAATRALEIKPLLADAQYALGLVQLREHDFTRGWEGYERRFETTSRVATVAAPRMKFTLSP